ncbi:MAG: ABC transporter substrate-binding protein [Chitinivibrionales bacterium]|nr:ABC transporter substrate-binding protein [Chitinivibrionales bacterium]
MARLIRGLNGLGGLLGIGACALLLTACDSGPGAGGDIVTSFPRNKTLYVGGFQWGAPVSFNPLHVTPAWPATGNMNLIYESMFGYNQITGQLEGILGTEYRFEDDKLHVTLHEKSAWQDGSPLTSEDVLYTFELHKKYNTLFHAHWNYIDTIVAAGPKEVVFTLSKVNYNRLMMLDIISVTFILPKKIFRPIEQNASDAGSEAEVLSQIREFKNDSIPLGSGPYTLHAYSNQKIILERVDSYWGAVKYGGRLPAPQYLIHMAYTGNDKFNLALQQGNLDLSQTFCPQIWNKFSKGVGTWYEKEPYYIPAMIPALLMGLTKAPFDDVAFRRACAHAIDYEKIKTLAVYGYTPDLKPGFILPFGTEKEYFSEQDAAEFGPTYDPAQARQILQDAGYSWGADSLLIAPDGAKVGSLTATCPAGWTDWETTVKIAVTGLRAVGVDVREKFVEYPVWDKNLKNGLFDFTMRTPHPEASPSCPWMRFEKVMSSKEWAPPGQVMYENEGRYKNPRADALLRDLPQLTDENKISRAYRELNAIFMKDIPVIALMYRPWHFYQFSTRHWTNFPSEKNPYAPPQCLMVGAGVKALWEIAPAK